MLTDNLVARIRSPTPVVFKQVTPSILLRHLSECFTGTFPMGISRKCVSKPKFSVIVDDSYASL